MQSILYKIAAAQMGSPVTFTPEEIAYLVELGNQTLGMAKTASKGGADELERIFQKSRGFRYSLSNLQYKLLEGKEALLNALTRFKQNAGVIIPTALAGAGIIALLGGGIYRAYQTYQNSPELLMNR